MEDNDRIKVNDTATSTTRSVDSFNPAPEDMITDRFERLKRSASGSSVPLKASDEEIKRISSRAPTRKEPWTLLGWLDTSSMWFRVVSKLLVVYIFLEFAQTLGERPSGGHFLRLFIAFVVSVVVTSLAHAYRACKNKQDAQYETLRRRSFAREIPQRDPVETSEVNTSTPPANKARELKMDDEISERDWVEKFRK